MRWLGRSVAVLLLLDSSVESGLAMARDLSLTIQTRDAVSGQPMVASIQFPLSGNNRKDGATGSFQHWTVSMTDGDGGKLIIGITATNYLEREITLRADAVASMLSKTRPLLRLAVAPKAEYNYSYLYNGLNFLSSDTDRALAYYDGPYSQIGTATYDKYTITLRYDYARALRDACINLGYDTCDTAAQLFQAMNDDFSQYQQIYNASRITQSLITDALAGLRHFEAKTKLKN